MRRPPSAEGGLGVAPSFEALLGQLREAHQLEVQELRRENGALRDQAEREAEQRGDAEAAVPDKGPPDSDSAHEQRLGPCVTPPLRPRLPLSSPEPSVALPGKKGDVVPPCAAVHKKSTQRGKVGRSRLRFGGVFERIEPKCLDLQTLCVERHHDKRWEDLSFHERVGLIHDALKPRHLLINPHCNFMKCWDSMIAIALVFVGLVTPYEVVFLSDTSWGLFIVNRIVDTLFALDIVLQFFLIAEVQRPHRGGSVLLRDPKELRMRYLKSWFAIDLVSILPFECINLFVASSSPLWQRAKILRCLKLSRILRLLRMARSSKIFQRWKNTIAISFHTQKLIRFFTTLVFVSHWMACLWGITGLTLGADVCTPQGELLDFGSAGVSVHEASWVTALYVGGKASPDNPCNHLEVYIASLHWAVMTLTSIGYGDIVPVRSEEYVVGIVCMLVGGVLWAYVIGSLCSIISNLSPLDRAFESNTDLLNVAMSEASVPKEERPKYREFLREARAYDRRICFSQVADSFSPMLRRQLMYHVEKDSLREVYYFRDTHAPLSFTMDIASRLSPKLFSRGESMDSLQHHLCLMDRGTVAHGRRILVRPSVFHEDFIITQTTFQLYVRTTSLTYAQVLTLTRAAMEETLERYPGLERRIRICAAKTAFCRAVHMAVVAYKGWKATPPLGRKLTLSQAFDRARTGFRSDLSCEMLDAW